MNAFHHLTQAIAGIVILYILALLMLPDGAGLT